jgi:multidrug efflux pump subunit AcrA (membrane-fusion protein)
VQTARVGSGEVTEVVAASGTIEPAAREQVAPELSTEVAAVTVANGDSVSKGQVVVRLEEPDQMSASLQQAQRVQQILGDSPSAAALGGGGAPSLARIAGSALGTGQAGSSGSSALRGSPPGGAGQGLAAGGVGSLDGLGSGGELDGEGLAGASGNPAAPLVAELDRTVRPGLERLRTQIEQTREAVRGALSQPELPQSVTAGLPESVTAALETDIEQLPSTGELGLDELEQTYRKVRQALLDAGEVVAEQRQATIRSVAGLAQQATTSLTRALSAAVGQATAALQQSAASLQRTLRGALGSLGGGLGGLGAGAGGLGGVSPSLSAPGAGALSQGTGEVEQEQLELTAPFDGLVEFLEGDAGGGSGLGELVPGLAGAASGVAGGLPGAQGGGGGGSGGGSGGAPRVGTEVSPGQPVFEVLDLSTLYVQANVDEIDVPEIEQGQRVTVQVDAFPDAQLRGVVETVPVTGQPGGAGGISYPVRIRLFEAPSRVDPKVGMTATADIVTGTTDSELVVPARALVRRDEERVVFAVRDGVARVVPVDVASLGTEQAAVTGQLGPDEQVIVAGYEDLADGDPVQAG